LTAPTTHRVGELEERVPARGEALVELLAEPGKLPERTGSTGVVHTDQLKPLVVSSVCGEKE